MKTSAFRKSLKQSTTVASTGPLICRAILQFGPVTAHCPPVKTLDLLPRDANIGDGDVKTQCCHFGVNVHLKLGLGECCANQADCERKPRGESIDMIATLDGTHIQNHPKVSSSSSSPAWASLPSVPHLWYHSALIGRSQDPPPRNRPGPPVYSVASVATDPRLRSRPSSSVQKEQSSGQGFQLTSREDSFNHRIHHHVLEASSGHHMKRRRHRWDGLRPCGTSGTWNPCSVGAKSSG